MDFHLTKIMITIGKKNNQSGPKNIMKINI